MWLYYCLSNLIEVSLFLWRLSDLCSPQSLLISWKKRRERMESGRREGTSSRWWGALLFLWSSPALPQHPLGSQSWIQPFLKVSAQLTTEPSSWILPLPTTHLSLPPKPLLIASLIHYVFLQIPAEQLQVCESKLEAKDKDVEKTGLHSNKESNP